MWKYPLWPTYPMNKAHKDNLVFKPARDPRLINTNLSLSPWIYYFTAGQTAWIDVNPGLKTNPWRHFHSYAPWDSIVRVLVSQSHFTRKNIRLLRFEGQRAHGVFFPPQAIKNWLIGQVTRWLTACPTCLEEQGTFAVREKHNSNCIQYYSFQLYTFQWNFIYIASVTEMASQKPRAWPTVAGKKLPFNREKS